MKLRKVNLLFISSTNYNKDLFDKLINKYLENKYFLIAEKKILIINRDLQLGEEIQKYISIYKEYKELSGNIKRLLTSRSKTLIKQIKRNIKNDYEWTIVTDNEMRNIELLVYNCINLSSNYPLIVIDHGCKNSQDIRFYQYLNLGRFIRNLVLLYFLCFESFNFKKFLLIKIKRIYLHSLKPKIPFNKYMIVGLQDLFREVQSMGELFPEKKINFELSKKKIGLLLTSGSHRYKSISFRKSSIVQYIKIISFLNKNRSIEKIVIKTKPGEEIALLKNQISQETEISKCLFWNSSKSINNIINEFDVAYVFTNLHSITFGALAILKMNVYGYKTNYPMQFKIASWYYKIYKPYKFIENILLDKQKFIALDSDKIRRWFFINKD